MPDVRVSAWFGRQRFARLRRRIYQLCPDIPDEMLPVVLALIERCAQGDDVSTAAAAVVFAPREAADDA